MARNTLSRVSVVRMSQVHIGMNDATEIAATAATIIKQSTASLQLQSQWVKELWRRNSWCHKIEATELTDYKIHGELRL
jgi:hypothetical protein